MKRSMPFKELNAKNGQFKKVKGLYYAANRRKFQQTIVEGPHAVQELLSSQPKLIRDIYATERALVSNPELSQLIKDIDPYLHLLPSDLFIQLSKDAQGILAVVNLPQVPKIDSLLANSQLILFALRISDPGNLGTIIRAADAFGAQAVVTGEGSVEAISPKVIRASAGSFFHLPVAELVTAVSFLEKARLHGFQVLAADSNADFYLDELANNAQNKSFNLANPTVWMMGNEAHGFSAQERALADRAVAIRMQGRAESLNISMATTICLYTSAQAQNDLKSECEIQIINYSK